ncbi:MAG: sigma E protease regulator RseP [Gymnodinialimonas sp.]
MEIGDLLGFAGGGLNMLLAFLFVLTILVFVHEYGHYWVAKKCGVKIEAFSIGFGPELFGWYDKSGTRWKFSLIPLGGYVKMFGDADPASTGLSEEGKGFDEAQKKVSFFHKPVSQRAAIVVAGPAANYLLALVLLTGLFWTTGEQYTPPIAAEVVPGMPAEQAGFQEGDTIISLDGDEVKRFEDIQQRIAINSGTPVDFQVQRGDQIVDLTATPMLRELEDRFCNRSTIAQIGLVAGIQHDPVIAEITEDSLAEQVGFEVGDRITKVADRDVTTFWDIQWVLGQPGEIEVPVVVERDGQSVTLTMTREPNEAQAIQTGQENNADAEIKPGAAFSDIGFLPPPVDADLRSQWRIEHNPVSAVGAAGREVWRLTSTTLKAIGQIIVGTRSVEELGGPLRIAKLSGDFAGEGLLSLTFFIAWISVSLGLINLMPVPVLDGGHLTFYAIEAIRRRPLSLNAQEWGMRIGMAMVLCLVVFATWNDLNQLGVFDFVKGLVGLGS